MYIIWRNNVMGDLKKTKQPNSNIEKIKEAIKLADSETLVSIAFETQKKGVDDNAGARSLRAQKD
jgi:hypothetical protein